jgi:hypothetical protein
VINAGIKPAMIEFMISHNVNYMRKLKTATLEKITETSHPLLLTTEISKSTVTIRVEVEVWMFVKIRGDHDVTT